MNDLILDKKSEYDEINLYQVFDTLWISRWKILVATMLGVALGFITSLSPSIKNASIDINLPSSTDFYNYQSVNYLINESGFDYVIDAPFISNLTTTKLSDDLSIIKIIESSEYIDELFNSQEIIKNKKNYTKNILDNFDYLIHSKPNSLNKHSISQSSSNTSNPIKILEEIIKGIKQLVKIEIILNLDAFIETTKISYAFKKENLETDIKELTQNLELKLKQRISYLEEQAEIANKLNIKDDFYRTQIAKLENSQDVSIRFSQQNMPYYYHGYVALNSEIEVLESKSLEELLLSSGDYLNILANLSRADKKHNLLNLINAKNFLKADDMSNWLHYDMNLITEIQRKDNVLINGVMYGLIALIMISFYIFITSNYVKYKKNLN